MKKIISMALCLAMVLQLFAVCMPVLGLKAEAAAGNAVYVSPDGNDSWSGTIDKPLKTLDAARSIARRDGVLTIYFREGTYFVNQTLSFSSADNNITFSAYNNEKVVFSGGYLIDNWKTEYLNGKAVWTSDIDTSKISGDFNTLFGQGGFLQNSRLPETGYYYAAAGADAQDPSNATFSQNKAFIYKNNDISAFYDYQNIHIRLFHYWVDEYLNIVNIDTANKKVTFDITTRCTVSEGDAYYLENVREALDKQGEWYIDDSQNKLYYIPFENETIGNAAIYAGGLEKLMSFSGCSGIAFSGITFSDTNWSGNGAASGQADNGEKPCVEVNNSSNISFTDCTFTNIGETCINFGTACSNCTVTGCEFKNIGAHAIYINGANDSSNITKNMTVTDNHIYNYGIMRPQAVAVFQTYAQYSNISHNEIHHGPYTAISVGWTWGYGSTVNNHNTISDNLIYDIGHAALSDMGGIYLLGIADGTVVSGNVISDVAAGKDASTYGGWGIYLDEGSTNVTVRDNLVYDCDSQGYHQHYGQKNTVQNNIFALNKDAQVRSSRTTTKSELGSSPVTELYLYNNVIVGDGQMMYQMVAKGRFTDSQNLYYDYLFSRNQNGEVYSSTDDNTTLKTKSEMQATSLGYYKNGVFADPCFVDYENRNFNFTSSSGYGQISFTPYNFGNAGSQKFGSRYLVNNLSHEKSWYEPEKWNRYETAKKNAIENRNAETVAELQQAYNALQNSQQVSSSIAQVTNTADWKMTGECKTSLFGSYKSGTYAAARTNLFVSGVSHGSSISDASGSDLPTAYPTESINSTYDVDMRGKAASASAVMYVDMSEYSDMSDTDLRIGGNIESASGQGMRYYLGLAAPGASALNFASTESYTTGTKTYSITKGLENSPLVGKPGSKDVSVSSDSLNKTATSVLKGAVPAKGETVNLRIVGMVLIQRTSDCSKYSRNPGSHAYYCINSYLDLSLVGVDKSILRKAYNKAVADGRTDSAVTNAFAVLNSADKSQSEIDAAASALSTAAADKAALLNAINFVPAYSNAEYTTETWNAYYTTLENGRAVYDDPFAAQSEVDAAASELTAAYNGLIDCRKLINKFSSMIPLHAEDYSQYAWYEFGTSLEDIRTGLISSTSSEQDSLIAAFNSKYDSLLQHTADNKTIYYYLSQHKPNECYTSSRFYVSGVAGGSNLEDGEINFDNNTYENVVNYDAFSLKVASNNKHATANMYVDRSIYSDLSQTAMSIGVDLDVVMAGSMRAYILFADNYTPTISNRDSITVNGKTYTVGVGTYENPVIGVPGGSDTLVGTTINNVRGKSGPIYGPVPNAGETVSFRLASCVFNRNFGMTAFYCVNSFIDFNIYGVDKSQLREYAFDTYSSAPEGCDTTSSAYAEYQAALAAADNVIYTDSYAQTAIDAAAQRLKTAYENIKPKPVITVDFGGADNQTNYTGTYSLGDIITLPAAEKDGFDFKGWMLSDGTMLTGNEYTVGSKNETITAQWSERILYSDVSSVDYKQNIIYGFEPALDDLSDYLELKESGCTVVYDKSSSKVGTGTLVKVYKNGELKETYTAVLFGDVTGDGWYDGNDAVVVSCIANGMLDENSAGFAEYMAADCNHDGVIDEFDVQILNDAGVILVNVNQANDPITVDSLYTEYLNAVSQTPDAADDTPTSEPEIEENAGIFDYISSFLRRIAEIIIAVVEFVKNIF